MKNTQYIGSIIVIKNRSLLENIPFRTIEEGNNIFVNQLKQYLSNFDDYNELDINTLLDQGYECFGKSGQIFISQF